MIEESEHHEEHHAGHYHKVRIHIDQKRYISPNPTTAHALYALGEVRHGHQLFREVRGDEEDEPIFRNEEHLHLTQDEHFHSSEQPFKGFEVIVNARQKLVHQKELTFTEVIALAFQPVPTGPNWLFTVAYRKGAGKKHEGTLSQGESVKIKNGTIFNVTATDKS